MIARPPMIRTDTSNAFAHNTMRVRVPDIIRDTQKFNPGFSPIIHHALDELRDGMENNAPIPALQLPAPDYDSWLAAYQTHAGDTWLNTEWFYAEVYFYRLLIEAVRWWETGRDPFTAKKQEELASPKLWELVETALSAEGSLEERLSELLAFDLWGNRIDLSFAASMAHGSHATDDDLLADDRDQIVPHLLRTDGAIHFIIDNTGTELAMDLVLVDALLRDVTDSVYLHLKMHPTFVSDATVSDTWELIQRLEDHEKPALAELGQRLHTAAEQARLRLIPDFYWNSTLLMRDMPTRITTILQDARMVFVKGDANYRRLVDDALWLPDTPFADVVSYFPAPVTALRSMKSDTIVGLPTGLAEILDTIDSQWRVNGKRGVLQARL